MTYLVRFTDSRKESLVVQDLQVNDETSLNFPGRNVVNYGQMIGENDLHLLENFADIEPPFSPVEGQLWYDTTPGVNQLKVFDGTIWTASGGLLRSLTRPSNSDSAAGDLWVDTVDLRLYLYNGIRWVLVGPMFNEDSQTGVIPETIVDIANESRTVLKNYIDGAVVAIVSVDEFTPKRGIPGFTIIHKGITFNEMYNTISGIADTASSLLIGTTRVPAANFVRKDTVNIITSQLKVKSNTGVIIGSEGILALSASGNNAIIKNTMPNGTLDFKITTTAGEQTAIKVIGRNVGINTTSPDQALDVSGNMVVSKFNDSYGRLFVKSNLDSTGGSTGAVVIDGGATIKKSLYVTDTVNAGVMTARTISSIDNKSVIGSASNKFKSIYAANFFGTFNGNVRGSLTGDFVGSATKLKTPSYFRLSGEVSSNEILFDGSTGDPSVVILTSSAVKKPGAPPITLPDDTKEYVYTVTLTFGAEQFTPFDTNTEIRVRDAASDLFNGDYVVKEGTPTKVVYEIVAANVPAFSGEGGGGIITTTNDLDNRKTLVTSISSNFFSNKPVTTEYNAGDELIIRRRDELYRITKTDFLNTPSFMPTGAILPFAGPDTAVPRGWLLCDGGSLSKDNYEELFTVIGARYGSSGNSFKLPDLRGRVILGLETMDNPDGTEMTPPNRVTNNAAITLGGAGGKEMATVNDTNGAGLVATESETGPRINVMNPYLTLNYIIFTGKHLNAVPN